MDAKCSCPVCDTFSCYSKHSQRGSEPYNDSTILSKVHPQIDFEKPLPIGDKVDIIASHEIKDEVEIDKESEKSIETASFLTTDEYLSEKLKDFQLLPSSRNTLYPSVAKLSAQVMNFPFNEYQSALSQQKVASQTNIAKLTSFDIFEKIKEVYKACSCKVCECIVGKPQSNQVCNCKPCDCEDCTSNGRVTISKAFRSIEVAQAEPDYQRFNNGLLSGFVRPDREISQSCKCKPCECHQCFKTFSIPCKCKRCSCVECESRYQRNYQKLVVAAVESDNQTRQDCVCSPCHCAECSHRYGASSRIRHEVSTEILRHLGCHCNTCLNNACAPEGTDACTCERGGNKVVRKPIQRDTDFDIHRSLVTHQKFGLNNTKTKHDLIAMFAAVSKSYTGYHESNHCCTCGRCGCMYCSSKFAQSSADAVKSSTVSLDSINHDVNDTLRSENSAINSKVTSRKSCLKTSIQSDMNRPMYTDHQKLCTEIKATNIYSLHSAKSRTCSKDNMLDTCPGEIESREREYIYPIKKGEKLTPYTFARKINKSYIRFCDKKEEDYETPAKKARISTDFRETFFNIPATKGDNKREYSHIKYNDIDIKSMKHNDKVMKHVKPFDENFTPELKFSTAYGENTSNSIFRFDRLGNRKPNDDSCINILDNTESNKNYVSNVSFKTNASENDRDTESKKYREKLLFQVDNVLSDRITHKLNRLNNSSTNIISQTVSSCDKDSRTDTICHENKSVCNIESNKENVLLEENENPKQSELQEELKNLLYNDDNYRRVEKTLKEARDFTQQLMKLLNKYEKANQEFESVYDKLKNHNITTHTLKKLKFQGSEKEPFQEAEDNDLKEDFDKIPNKETNEQDNFIEREKVPQHIDEYIADQSEKESLQDQSNKIKKESKSISKLNISGDCLVNNIITHMYLTQDKADVNDTSYDSKTSTNDGISQFKEDSPNTLSVDSSIVTDDVIKCESGLNPITQSDISPISQITFSAHNKRRRCKKYSQIYKQAVAASKRSKLFAPLLPKSSVTTGVSQDLFENYNKTETTNTCTDETAIVNETTVTKIHGHDNKMEIRKELNPILTTDVNYLETKTFIQPNIEPKIETIKLPEVIKNQEVKVVASKSNESQFSLGVYRKRSLEKGIKEAVNAIKQASVTWETKYAGAHKTSHGNEALSKLHSEVKKLLQLPLLQKCKIKEDCSQHRVTDINRRANNTDALKVSFLAAHQMSDRNIVVTWLAPRVLDNVTGYEILVNGRFAQKIYDQTCCETVLTHLPRSDKILLTVRTLTNSDSQSEHTPCSTVVYKPRLHLQVE